MGHCSPAWVSKEDHDWLQELVQWAGCAIEQPTIGASWSPKCGIDAAGVVAGKNFHTSSVEVLIVLQPANNPN